MALQRLPASNLGIVLLTIDTAFMCLAATAVGLRIWCARIVSRKLRIHDYLIFTALLLVSGLVIQHYLSDFYGGVGHHTSEVPKSSIFFLLKMNLIACLTWLSATVVIKTSVLCFYLEIFKVQRTFRKLVYATLGLVVLFYGTFLATNLTKCQPLAHLWDPSIPGYCQRITASQIASTIVNAIIDLLIVIMPIPVVLKLQLEKKAKWRIIGIFAVGFVICVLNLVRLIDTIIFPQKDITYDIVGPAILTSLEVEIGIINACLPTINPLFSAASRHRQNRLQQGRPSSFRKLLNAIFSSFSKDNSCKQSDSLVSSSNGNFRDEPQPNPTKNVSFLPRFVSRFGKSGALSRHSVFVQTSPQQVNNEKGRSEIHSFNSQDKILITRDIQVHVHSVSNSDVSEHDSIV